MDKLCQMLTKMWQSCVYPWSDSLMNKPTVSQSHDTFPDRILMLKNTKV